MNGTRVFGLAACGLAVVAASVVSAQQAVAPPPRQVTGEVSLLVVENLQTTGWGVDRQRILRVKFKNGIMQPSEVGWEGPWDIYLGLGAQFVQNRYVVTTEMSVIDVVAGKSINPRSGKLIAVDGDEIAYRVDTAYRDVQAGVYTFNLKTHTNRKVGGHGEGKYGLPGKRSPRGTKSVANDWDEIDAGVPKPYATSGELMLYRVGEPRRSLGKSFSVQSEAAGQTFSALSLLPILWLGDSHFLTQAKNGELITVSLDGTRTPVVKIPWDNKQRFNWPNLEREPGGRLIYSGYGGPAVVIDVKNRKWEKRKWADLGHGFDMSEIKDKDGFLLRHNGREIGRVWSSPWHTKTTDGYVALEAWRDDFFVGGSQEQRVWSAATGRWSTLQMKSPECIIGWTK
ncbi:hypothetical protein [Fimbriiglobus ruber]|uniref:Uncharacterized protein n=1 Tax=Fimbriiglobus ruber TaxID=1908690 RepID=A0A225DJW8_9BACT|nr:hypothetical protein [Fimbriiglobus ruber]OWK37489.1 hypothetical protein FRUB_06609 [Fimbriiglobus ruber]